MLALNYHSHAYPDARMNNIDAGKSLALAGSLRKPLIWLLALTGFPFVVMIVALTLVLTRLPAGSTAHMPTAALFAPVIVLFAMFLLVRSLVRTGVTIDQGELVVNTGLGRKRIALSRLRAHGLRVVDLNEHGELKPFIRTWGTGLPGFAGGWFRLRNGEKAVCVVLDRSRVSYLRSAEDNLSILLSLAEPEKLRALLERQRS